MALKFHELQAAGLKEKRSLKAFIPKIFKAEGKAMANLDVIFCSDNYLLDINNKFLNHDYYTDIITFDLSQHAALTITGEIYISVDRVAENSVTHQTSYQSECRRVLFHGVLHLCGYKDKTKVQMAVMREKEEKYLSSYLHGSPWNIQM